MNKYMGYFTITQLESIKDKKYLLQSKLGHFLKELYQVDFIENKTVPDFVKAGYKFRPDFRNEELKLLIEYDGPRHYTESRVIFKDQKVKDLALSCGYTLIRIPYFVQLSTETIKILFNKDFLLDREYPHGFVDNKVIYPADFCQTGTERFIYQDLLKFKDCSEFMQDLFGSLWYANTVLNRDTSCILSLDQDEQVYRLLKYTENNKEPTHTVQN